MIYSEIFVLIPGENDDTTRHFEPMETSVTAKNLELGAALAPYFVSQSDSTLNGALERIAKKFWQDRNNDHKQQCHTNGTGCIASPSRQSHNLRP